MSGSNRQVSEFWVNKYKGEIKKSWDLFYKRNATRFFKDRHWIDREFEGYFTGNGSGKRLVVLEAGCGVGNLVFPALERHRHLFIYCCDISNEAIKLVRQNPAYNESNCFAFVCNLVNEPLAPLGVSMPVDIATSVFVLSALPSESHRSALANIVSVLDVGGVLLFRDYAKDDLAEQRFQQNDQPAQLEPNLYVRQDSTLSYFFTVEGLRQIVADLKEIGYTLQEVALHVVETTIENRKDNKVMHRRFIQGVWKKLDPRQYPALE